MVPKNYWGTKKIIFFIFYLHSWLAVAKTSFLQFLYVNFALKVIIQTSCYASPNKVHVIVVSVKISGKNATLFQFTIPFSVSSIMSTFKHEQTQNQGKWRIQLVNATRSLRASWPGWLGYRDEIGYCSYDNFQHGFRDYAPINSKLQHPPPPPPRPGIWTFEYWIVQIPAP